MTQQVLNLDIGNSPPSRTRSKRSGPALSPRSSGALLSRDEMNLAEFPLAVLSTRVNSKIKTLEFRDTQRLKNGELLEREWIITGADKFGLPTSTDDDVILGLMRLTMNQGFRERKVYFTRYELLKILRWSTEGRSYTRLNRSLDRLSGVRVKASNAFYDNSTKSFQTINFGVLDAYEINDERGSKHVTSGEPPKSYFIWSEVLFDSFKAGFIKKLDMEFYLSLRSAVSRRLYRYLDKHFYYKPQLERRLPELAFEKLGLSRNYKYVSSIKQQLEPALAELQEREFLSHYEYTGRGNDTRIRFYAYNAQQAKSLIEDSAGASHRETRRETGRAERQTSGEASVRTQLAQMLVSRGISPAQVRRLLHGRDEVEQEKIREVIEYYDHLVETKDHKISRNKVGFLYRAVEGLHKFVVPKHFREYRKQSTSANVTRREVSSDRDQELALQRYRSFVDEKVRLYRSNMKKEEVQAIYALVEQKMAPLRSVLDGARFNEALEGCVSDEISKIAGVPEFRSWLQGAA